MIRFAGQEPEGGIELSEARDYQEECLETLDGLENGAYLVVMATGLGKTWVFTHVRRRGRVLILSHREELVHQPEKYYAEQGCSFGVEQAKEFSDGEEVVSASVQTLVRRLDRFRPDDFDLLITDEAHHSVAPVYRKIYDYFQPRLHLGFTATPNRADSVKLGNIYSKVVFQRDIKWGIQNGWLSNIRCERIDIGYNICDARTTAGDFNQGDIEVAVDIRECNEVIADIYRKKAIGPTIIFAASVNHARRLQELIPEAEVVTAETENRRDCLKRFEEGETPVLINCMVLTEGTDLPMVRTIIICRPTRSAAVYVQMVGRGLRLYPGKEELLLIDCVGATRLPICTAPILFGLDPEKVGDNDRFNGRLITELQEEAEQMEAADFSNPDAWRVNAELVDLFEKNGNYDTHGVDYTVCANGNFICSIGDGLRAIVTPEDITGNSSVFLRGKQGDLYAKRDIPVQDAFDDMYEILSSSFAAKRHLWDADRCRNWGRQLATEKQKTFIQGLFDESFLSEIDFASLTKNQASRLIDRGLEEQRSRRG
ncbi:MAG: DEAD/DEAH box helicase [Clostridiales bacterium]|nr:DEAD/DEAH box helicase [Clostridiales bacterium]